MLRKWLLFVIPLLLLTVCGGEKALLAFEFEAKATNQAEYNMKLKSEFTMSSCKIYFSTQWRLLLCYFSF